jgi:L-cysteine:1D-myo-inositol 2-amino-2-deoxy-alpha-D-glucopyranoside ligase
MNLYDSLTQAVQPVRPEEDHVKLYICGITPYDTTHLGHAFTYTTFDILIRYLEMQGYRVTYVQNVTDIDDDILRKAREEGDDWRSLGNRWTAHFIRDMQALNVRPPDYYPRATDVIPEIVRMISELFEAGKAYESGGSVYYRVDAYPEFGKLSHLPRAEMLPVANERGNRPGDPNKQDPLDFVLWQAQAPGEPAWPSPWGPGRPGWHIECSAMSTHFLGLTLDIHSGGGDLIFPHHECEIAQVEPVTGQRPFVRTWMHVAMVRYGGEKMSKSLGNLVMIRDLLQTWSPDAIRLYLAMHHYRDSWSHNEQELVEANRLANKLREAVSTAGGTGPRFDPGLQEEGFRQAMENDLDSPLALAFLSELAEGILAAGRSGESIQDAQEALRHAAEVFGLRFDANGPEPRVLAGWDQLLQRFIELS